MRSRLGSLFMALLFLLPGGSVYVGLLFYLKSGRNQSTN